MQPVTLLGSEVDIGNVTLVATGGGLVKKMFQVCMLQANTSTFQIRVVYSRAFLLSLTRAPQVLTGCHSGCRLSLWQRCHATADDVQRKICTSVKREQKHYGMKAIFLKWNGNCVFDWVERSLLNPHAVDRPHQDVKQERRVGFSAVSLEIHRALWEYVILATGVVHKGLNWRMIVVYEVWGWGTVVAKWIRKPYATNRPVVSGGDKGFVDIRYLRTQFLWHLDWFHWLLEVIRE